MIKAWSHARSLTAKSSAASYDIYGILNARSTPSTKRMVAVKTSILLAFERASVDRVIRYGDIYGSFLANKNWSSLITVILPLKTRIFFYFITAFFSSLANASDKIKFGLCIQQFVFCSLLYYIQIENVFML